MPTSNQTPLITPRGGDVHDFAQSFATWEAAVFDGAEYYCVLLMRCGRLRIEFPTFREAVAYARSREDEGPCAYAISSSGRSVVLDHEVWDEWIEREANPEVPREDARRSASAIRVPRDPEIAQAHASNQALRDMLSKL